MYNVKFTLIILCIVSLQIVEVFAQRNIEQIGVIHDYWKDAMDIEEQDGLLYIAAKEFGLRILDISDPTLPVDIGHCDTDGMALALAVSGDYAYIADNHEGICIIEISDVQNPILRWSDDVNHLTADVAVSGNYAYFADRADHDHGVRIFDIRDPQNPVEAGGFITAGNARGITVSGDFAYVADYDNGLLIVDITDPQNPVQMSQFDTHGQALRVEVSGEFAYVANYDNDGLLIIDVSDPQNPTACGSFNAPDMAMNVTVWDDYAIVTDYNGWYLVDVNDPENPSEIDFIRSFKYSHCSAIVGDTAFLGGNGIYVVNIEDMNHPDLIGHRLLWNPINIVTSGNLLFVADDESGLRVVDINNPENPTEIGYCHDVPHATNVALAGDIACLTTNRLNSGLYLVNIAEPENPVLIGQFNYETNEYPLIQSSQDYVFISCNSVNGPSGVLIIDIRNPEQPEEIAFYETPGVAREIALRGDLAFIACDGLCILNISDPANPEQIGYYETNNTAGSVSVSDNFAYLSGAELHPLLIIDISDPENPFLAGSFELIESESNLFLKAQGNYVYFTTNGGRFHTGGIRVIDISDPEDPFTVGIYWLDEYAYHLDLDDEGIIYVTNPTSVGIYRFRDPNGIAMIKPNLPSAFRTLSNYPNPFNSQTTISYSLPIQSNAVLNVYNTGGQLVEELVNQQVEAGRHSVVWNGGGFGAGIYFVKLQDTVNNREASQKILMIK